MKNKRISTGGIIGVLYALVPFLVNLLVKTGNPWELYPLLLPFYPSGLTFLTMVVAIGSLTDLVKISVNEVGFQAIFWTVNVLNLLLWGWIGAVIGRGVCKLKSGRRSAMSDVREKKNSKKIAILLIGGLLLFLATTNVAMAVEWQYGQTHIHTGYSTKLGYDKQLGGGDDCYIEGYQSGIIFYSIII